MADYRQVHVQIWDDPWFCQLSSDEKVVFFWFFSNRRAAVSGLYKFTEFICARETGLSIDVIKECIKKISGDEKIYVEGEWVWVKNLRKYNDSKSPNSYKRISSDLSQLPDNGLKKAYITYYNDDISPYQAPTKPLLEQEQEHEHEKEHEKEHAQEPESDARFSSVQKCIETLVGILPSGKASIDAINDIVKMKATDEDIKAGFQWLKEQGKTIRYYSSLVGPTQTAMSKRIQKTNGNNRHSLDNLTFDNVESQ